MRPSWLCKWRSKVKSSWILFCISETVGPIEPKFCMRMECDQMIKSHKNINLIWGHLGHPTMNVKGLGFHCCVFHLPVINSYLHNHSSYVVAETILYKTHDTYFSLSDDVITVKFSISGTVGPIEHQILYARGAWSGNFHWWRHNVLRY